jgi:hypothetical protein
MKARPRNDCRRRSADSGFTTVEKEANMKRSRKIALGIVTVIGLGLPAAAVLAHPGGMMGGMMGGMGQGPMHYGSAEGAQLMTPEERLAMRDKMRNAATFEERRALADANHADMQKRAKDRGIALPTGRGPHYGHGPRLQAPEAAK